MKIYNRLSEFDPVDLAVVTMGTFDGVHAGHRKILNRLTNLAEPENGQTVILTFDPHPRQVLYPEETGLMLLNTLDEKIDLLDKEGIDHLIIHPFTKEFSRINSTEFIRDILINTLNTKKLVIGYNHHFGRNREGSFEHLSECASVYGFEVQEIPAQEVDEVKVSSTIIRAAIARGEIQTASTYLGYDYQLSGNVVEGSQRGHDIGFPTANIAIEDQQKLIPAVGVYAVRLALEDQWYNGMLNIGTRPTFNGDSKQVIEVHIFDFDKLIYDKKLTIYFRERIRDEKKFDNIESFRNQLEIDKNKSLRILI